MKRPSLSEMTLREKIGQTALGYPTSPGCAQPERYPYGCIWGLGNLDMGVINMADRAGEIITDLPDWVRRIEKLNRRLPVPVLQASDSTTGIHECFQETHALMDCVTIGATGSQELAYEAGVLRARLEKCVGGRWVWCPEIDLSNRRKGIMLGRQYSDDPDTLMRMALADMKGVQSQRVAATAKHFPGCDGLEYRDAHVCENMIVIPMDKWKATQGAMFKQMIDAGVDSVMIAHAAFPACDPTMRHGRYLPASVSRRIITDLLKGEMGFEGVVITDAVEMRSLATLFDADMNQVYIEAIKAGNDVVLGVRDSYFDAIEGAVLRGEIDESRIDDACRRVLNLKEKLGLFDDRYAPVDDDLEAVNAAVDDFNRRVARRAVSLVCDRHSLLPLKQESIRRVSIVYSGHDSRVFDRLSVMKAAFERRGAKVHMQRRLADIADIDALARSSDLIVYAGYLMRYAPAGFSGFFGDELRTFHYFMCAGAEKSLGIGLGSPFMYYDYYTACPTFVNAYNATPEMQEAVVAALYGEIPMLGGEPFSLVPKEVKQYLKQLGLV